MFINARELTKLIYNMTGRGPFSKDYSLKDQIRRSAISIISNIAEGFERGSNKDFVKFLFISKASCGEARAQLTIAFDQKYIEESDYSFLVNKCMELSKKISSFIKYLETCGYKERNRE